MTKCSVVCYGMNNVHKDLSIEISKNHRIYCSTHNYTYSRTNNLLNSLLGSSSDYTIVVNDLCLFLNMNKSVHNFINLEDHIFLPLYQPTKHYNINNNYICSDVFIVRNSAWSMDFLKTWLNSGDKISEFIENRVDISEKCDIQNISILGGDFRVCSDFAHKNIMKGRESMILNMSGMTVQEMVRITTEYNNFLGVL